MKVSAVVRFRGGASWVTAVEEHPTMTAAVEKIEKEINAMKELHGQEIATIELVTLP